MDKPQGSLAAPYWTSPLNTIQVGDAILHRSVAEALFRPGSSQIEALTLSAYYDFRLTNDRPPTKRELLTLLRNMSGQAISARTLRRILARPGFPKYLAGAAPGRAEKTKNYRPVLYFRQRRRATIGAMKENQPPLENIRGIRVVGELETEWLRVNDAVRAFGLSRPHLFELIAQKRIESKHIRRPGAEKGIRLINAASLRAYIASFED